VTKKEEEKSLAKTTFIVLSWFAFNISMANVGKWLYLHGEICIPSGACKKYDFPLTMTSFDIAVGRLLCYIYMRLFMPTWPAMSLTQQLQEVAPLAACFALSVGMGNLSLKYIYPSFNQMIGASSPAITVLMMVVFTSTRYNLWTWLSMPVICGGLCICVSGEVNYHILGVLSCIGAAVLRGAKSIMQAKLLAGARIDSVTLLYYMSPYAAVVLYLFALCIEGIEPVTLIFRPHATGVSFVVFLLVLTAFNAWFLSIANFLVTYHTNPVTLQVLGNVKTCLSIIISVCIFRNQLGAMQCVGVASSLFGVWLYGSKGKSIKPDSSKNSKAD